jgi:hypothetical protein
MEGGKRGVGAGKNGRRYSGRERIGKAISDGNDVDVGVSVAVDSAVPRMRSKCWWRDVEI